MVDDPSGIVDSNDRNNDAFSLRRLQRDKHRLVSARSRSRLFKLIDESLWQL